MLCIVNFIKFTLLCSSLEQCTTIKTILFRFQTYLHVFITIFQQFWGYGFNHDIKVLAHTCVQTLKLIILAFLLYIISMFNIEATSANDTHYVPKSKRMWTYGLTAKLHIIMEDMLTKLAQYTQVYLGPDKFRPHPSPNRLNRHAPRGNKRAAHLLMMTSVFTAHAADTKPLASMSHSGTLTLASLVKITAVQDACPRR